MAQYTWESSSKVVKAEVKTLVSETQGIVGENLIGIYLHGSLALGGFNPERSDIDLLIVTREKIPLSQKRQLIEVCLRVSKAPCPLEISFVVKHELFSDRYPLPYDLHYSERWRERFTLDLRNGGWQNWDAGAHDDPDLVIYLTVLHRVGIVLYGQPINEALPVVPERIFRAALLADFQYALDNRNREPIYFVLNACRIYAYLRDGKLLSKDAGGEWGLEHLPEQYQPLIQQSLALYRSERLSRPSGRALFDSFASMIAEAVGNVSASSSPDTGEDAS